MVCVYCFCVANISAVNAEVIQMKTGNAITDDELSIITLGLDEAATEKTKSEAVIAMYYAADRIQRATKMCLKVGEAKGKVKSGFSGDMTYKDFCFRYNNKFYEQSAGQVINIGIKLPNAINVARNKLDRLSKTYSNDMKTFNGVIAKSGKDAKRPNVNAYKHFPYVKADYSSSEKRVFSINEWKNYKNIRNNVTELSNIQFSENIIDNALISYDKNKKIYNVSFELDLSLSGNREYENAVYYARKALRNAAKTNDLDYSKYKITMKIKENGHIDTYTIEESWKGTMKFSIVKIKCVSESCKISKFYWDWNSIQKVIKQGYPNADTPEKFIEQLNTGI